ncbi:MAG TPA: Ig-like domain-containing protein [Gaiellaceae bacterium]|nr:Ig-like domain-containing protein [Gaiellaceae bacterium]
MSRRILRPGLGLAVLLVVLAAPPVAQATSPNLVVSQVYGGGGNTGAPFTHDYVELFNRSAAPVSLDGLSIQYASATGTGNFGANSGQLTELPNVTLQPGRYFLVQQAVGAGSGVPLPTPDVIDPTPIAMAAGAGKVALVTGTTTLGCNGGSNPCDAAQLARIVDLVGYGNANFFEGAAAAPTLTNTTAAFRAAGGCTDTDQNAADFSAAAPNPRNTASPLNACPADPAPTVSSTTPANGATNVALDATITIDFSEPVTTAPGWYSISCSASGAHAAAEAGGPQSYTLTPTTPFSFSETCTVTVDAGSVTDHDGDPQTMEADYVFGFSTVGSPVSINEIQGAGHISPLDGQSVSGVTGIVTALRSNGFYMQDPDPDADPATSDAIFVFTSFSPASLVSVGDSVSVGGTVSEFRPGGVATANLTTTEIVSPTVTVASSGNALPAPTVVGVGGRMPPTEVIHPGTSTGSVETAGPYDAADHGIDFYESLEAMLLQVNDPVVVGPTNNFGETVVLPDDGANAAVRTPRGGLVVRDLTPSLVGDYRQGDFNPERVMIDDEITRPLPRANVGDGYTSSLVGPLDYSFGNFKIQVTNQLERVDNGLQREVATPPRDQEIAIATFNVENLHPGSGAQFAALAELVVENLGSPDLIGIEEVQDNNGPTNDGTVDASVTWEMLIGAIQAAGGPHYEYRQIDPVNNEDGGQPGGNIRVGFLFHTERGLEFIDRPGGDATTATQPVAHPSGLQLSLSPGRVDPQDPAWEATRKPLAGEFRFRGKKLVAVVNHFSSKGGDDPLYGRFQPPVRHTEAARHQQAAVVNEFVQQALAADPNAYVVVLGDINDFEFSETVEILEGDELHGLMDTLPQAERYSYVFEGNSQVLDQTLVTQRLFDRLVEYDVVHVNSEFSLQTSDHEPQVARFNMIGRP